MGVRERLKSGVDVIALRMPSVPRRRATGEAAGAGGERPWVLVTDGGSGQGRSAVAAVRALASGGYRAAVTVSGGASLAAASRSCSRVVCVAPVEDAAAYAAAVRAEVAARPYLAVLGASDAALLALGAPVGHLVDKARLARGAERVGLAAPPTREFPSLDALLAAADALDYPIALKPTVSRSPARRVGSAVELARLGGRAALSGPVLVQPYLDAPMSSVAGVVWQGRLVAGVAQRYLRTWPVECGTASAAVTVSPDPDLEQRLVRLLEGYDGLFQAQFVGSWLLDLNPRVYGSLPLAVSAGANLVAVYCDLLRGRDVRPVRGRPGVAYRWLEGELRHAAWGVREGRLGAGPALRLLRPVRGAAHSVASLRDPGPALARARYVLGQRERKAAR